MKGDLKGIDTVKAQNVMKAIQRLKSLLDSEYTQASSRLKNYVNDAFAGTQKDAINGYIDRLNKIIQNLYSYLDGDKSTFAITLNEVISSYVQSDVNVATSFNNAGK